MASRDHNRWSKSRLRYIVRRRMDGLKALRLRGDRFFCPVCTGSFSAFLPYGKPVRANARCPACGSFERHRLLWLFLEQRTDLFSGWNRLLDVAPVYGMQRRLRRIKKLEYLSVDLQSPLAMQHLDLTKTGLPGNTFDCLMCCHVLEHIDDDRAAMAELYRLVRPGGWAILQVPAQGSLEKTFEDESVVLPAERERLFGNWDHRRVYGRDYPDRLRAVGFEVHLDKFAAGLDQQTVDRCRVNRNVIIYYCTKPV